jgi:hypothetical protein
LTTYTVSKPSTDSKADSAASDTCSVKPLVDTSPGTDGVSPDDVALVVSVDPGGAGEVKPLVDTSPARAETENRQVKANVITKRFMDVSPLRFFGDAKFLTSK